MGVVIISVVLSIIISITITSTGIIIFLSKTNEIYERFMGEFVDEYSHKIKDITIQALKEHLERKRQ